MTHKGLKLESSPGFLFKMGLRFHVRILSCHSKYIAVVINSKVKNLKQHS